jgi:hypothetical protein
LSSTERPGRARAPETITKSTLKQYRHCDAVTDLAEFSDRGHSLTIDTGQRCPSRRSTSVPDGKAESWTR